MNVRTVRRFSKRTISTLLSILMVISLFTVCMTGTMISASAMSNAGGMIWFNNVADSEGNGGDWSEIYLYIGHGSYSAKFQFTYSGYGDIWYTVFPGGYNDADCYFFAGSDKTVGGSVYAIWDDISTNKKTRKMNQDIQDDQLFTPNYLSQNDSTIWNGSCNRTSDYHEKFCEKYNHKNGTAYSSTVYATGTIYDVNATLYNYRNSAQAGTDNSKDFTNGKSAGGNVVDLRIYSGYNWRVSKWFEAKHTNDTNDKYTPLYQGNFRQGKNTDSSGTILPSSVGESWNHFVSVANGANRKNGPDGNSTHAVAQNLVDDTLTNGTLTQYGVEIPQFSSAFEDYTVPGGNHTPNSHYQKSYNNLKFEMIEKVKNVSYTENGVTKTGTNKWYFYDSMVDGNRYYDTGTSKIKKGSVVRGADSDAQIKRLPGYYPFNNGQPSNIDDIINCFGTKFEINFNSTSDCKVHGENMVFKFTGDDDVWVFVDDYLALDLGGSHNKAGGEIDFANGIVTYSTGLYKADYKSVSDKDSASIDYTVSETKALDSRIVNSLKDTVKPHKLTIFQLERGLFDSNFSMSFMLPVVDNTFVMTHKVNADNVNDGLRLGTMEVANNDIFDVYLYRQFMAGASDNSVKLPISSNFTRNNPATTVKNTDTTNTYPYITNKTTTLQNTSGTDKNVHKNGLAGNPTAVTAAYLWTDASKYLDKYGKVPSVNAVAAASGSGVGIPDSGQIYLRYDQTAKFSDQFSMTVPNSMTIPPLGRSIIGFVFQDNLRKSSGDFSASTGAENVVEDTRRKASFYYDTSFLFNGGVKRADENFNNRDADATATGLGSGEVYLNNDHSSLTYEHTVKTGSLTISKTLEEGNDADKNGTTEDAKKSEHRFIIEFSNLFGSGNDTWYPAVGLVGVRSGEDAIGNRNYEDYDDNNAAEKAIKYPVVGANGIVAMVAGSSITFKGIPVDTRIRISEISTIHPITRVESSLAKVLFSGKVHFGEDNYDDNGLITKIVPEDGFDDGNYLFSTKKITDPDDDTSTVTRYTVQGDTAASEFYRMPEIASTNEAIEGWKYDFTNTYTKIPVLYRYVDRNIVHGKPTELQDGYTYFTKILDKTYSATLEEVSGKTVVKSDAQAFIAEQSPQIINVLCTYELKQNGKYRTDQKDVYANYFNGVTELSGEEKSQFELKDITTELQNVVTALVTDKKNNNANAYTNLLDSCDGSESKAVALKTAIRAIVEEAVETTYDSGKEISENVTAIIKSIERTFYRTTVGGTTHYHVIQATYENKLRNYDVSVEFYAPDEGITYNGISYTAGQLVSITVQKPFNDIVNLKDIVGGNIDETGKKLFKIHIVDGDNEDNKDNIFFAYWERQVTYRSGDAIVSKDTPVSTNFNYHYRVNDHIYIKAVYQYESDSTKRYKAGKMADQVAANSFVPYDEDVEISSLYSVVERITYRVYWKQLETGEKLYMDKYGNYTIPENEIPSGDAKFVRANYTGIYATHKDSIRIDAFSTEPPVTIGEVGTDERLYQVSYCVPNSNGEVGFAASATDRTYNSYSKEIVKNNKSVSQDRTRVDIMFGSVGSEDNDISSEDNDKRITQLGYVLFQSKGLKDDGTEYENNNFITETAAKTYMTDSDVINSAGTGSTVVENNGNYDVLSNYNVLIGKFNVVPSNVITSERPLGANEVVLTNKNRANIVFDMANTEKARARKYTCYTYMIRNNKVYISATPATFCLEDVNPAYKDTQAKKIFSININSYVYNEGETTTPATGCFLTSNYTTAVNGRNISYTANIPSLIMQGELPYTAQLVKLKIGEKVYDNTTTPNISSIAGGTMPLRFLTSEVFPGVTESELDRNYHSVDVKAYFEYTLAGKLFTLAPDDDGRTITVQTYNADDTNEDTALITDDNKVTMPYNKKAKVTVTLKEGYKFVSSSLDGFTRVSDTVYTKTMSDVLTNDTDRINSYTNLFGNLPTTEEIKYTLTVEANTGNNVSFTFNGTSYTATPTESKVVEFTHNQALDSNINVITFTSAITNNTSYTTPIKWVGATPGTDTTQATIVLSTQNLTVTATPKSKGIYIYFSKCGAAGTYGAPSNNAHKNMDYTRWSVYYQDPDNSSSWNWSELVKIEGQDLYKSETPIPNNAKFIITNGGNGESHWAVQANNLTATATTNYYKFKDANFSSNNVFEVTVHQYTGTY